MPTYIEHAKRSLQNAILRLDRPFVMGENINTGSMMSGLCRGLIVPEGGQIINLPNTESAHCGAGLGLALMGRHGILVVKQLDFMFLMLDQLVNSVSLLRAMGGPKGSLDIITTVVDVAAQGPQSSCKKARSFAALGGVDISTPDNQLRLDQAFNRIGRPGVRIIALFQSKYQVEL